MFDRLLQLIEKAKEGKPEQRAPVTEILEGDQGRDWKFAHTPIGRGGTDLRGKRMRVALDESEVSENHRRRELAQQAWLPELKPLPELAASNEVEPHALQAVFDMATNRALIDIGTLNRDAGYEGARSPDSFKPFFQQLDTTIRTKPMDAFKAAVSKGLELYGTGDFAHYESALRNSPLAMAAELINAFAPAAIKNTRTGKAPAWNNVVKEAKRLEDIYKTIEEASADEDSSSSPRGKQRNELLPSDTEAEEDRRKALQKLADKQIKRALGKDEDHYARSNRWGLMEIEEPERPNYHPAARVAKRRRADEAGAALRFPSRVFTDGMVFQTKRRTEGGAVLIDGSGSMGISPEQVVKILEIAPHTVVAIYSGGGRAMDKGKLRVLAKGGKMIDPQLMHSPDGYGNIVDGPALRWLTRQLQPRIWVCDGGVTGIGDAPAMHLNEECEMIKLKHRIAQINSVDQAIEIMEELRRKASR
jgi:hypothetical protein